MKAAGRRLPALALPAATDYAAAAACGGFALLLYLRTLAPGVLGGDSGEFQFTAWLGGFAHPTGYPLYLMLGYLWSHLLPFYDPAWRMNAFSAAWAALAVGLMYLLTLRALRWIASEQPAGRWLAAFGALTFALTPTFWSQAVVAEVYALHAVFIAAVLLAFVSWAGRLSEGRSGGRALAWAALLYGLSLTHHRTMVLLAPAILLFILVVSRAAHDRPSGRAAAAQWARLLLLVALPSVLYLYIPLRAPHAPYVRVAIGPGQVLSLYQADLAGFLDYVTGQAFSGEIRSGAGALAQILPAARSFVAELTWPGVALGGIGLLWLARRGRRLLWLTGLSFLSLLAFNLVYGIGDIYVYYIPLYLIWVLWAAFGVAGVSDAVWRAIPRFQTSTLPFSVAPLLTLILPAYLLITGYAAADRSRDTQVMTGWRALLGEAIPSAAVLVSNDRDEMTPLWYFQYVEGLRPDLTGLFPLIGPGAPWADVGSVVQTALRSGRPVLLIKPMPGLDVKYRLAPAGKRQRVLGPAATGAPMIASEATYGEQLRLLGYDFRRASPGGGPATVTLYWQVLRPMAEDYSTFVHLIDDAGAKVGQDDHRAGGLFYPTHLWKPGEVLVDEHRVVLPAVAAGRSYRIVAGLYVQAPGGDLLHLGAPATIGTVTDH